MKSILLVCVAACLFSTAFAQNDTTGKKVTDTTIKKETNDTIRIGGMIIIKKPGTEDREIKTEDHYTVHIPKRRKPENLTTNWWIIDVGFSGFNDKTVYGIGTPADEFAPKSTEDWFDIKSGKSRNINIWFFMQRLNMIKHVVNLKYGLGLELNNYFFDDETIRFHKNPTVVVKDDALKGAKKNKLAADYLTVPLMVNFNFTPERRNGFGFSFGMSAGYLYSARQKVKFSDDKVKVHNDFDLQDWKLSYVGEINLGLVKLYGSYAFQSMWERGLDQIPFNAGIRLSNW
ncbi:MAG TPA: outer membrane beta-barrel protein [Chitinophagaceae bacterium]|nr:outer membrane beta-barrel protein [Chitinophagaceae bacterium]